MAAREQAHGEDRRMVHLEEEPAPGGGLSAVQETRNGPEGSPGGGSHGELRGGDRRLPEGRPRHPRGRAPVDRRRAARAAAGNRSVDPEVHLHRERPAPRRALPEGAGDRGPLRRHHRREELQPGHQALRGSLPSGPRHREGGGSGNGPVFRRQHQEHPGGTNDGNTVVSRGQGRQGLRTSHRVRRRRARARPHPRFPRCGTGDLRVLKSPRTGFIAPRKYRKASAQPRRQTASDVFHSRNREVRVLICGGDP
mmetsp:Transcript_25295/g.59206  ORF Transcript_25295/g.59206 Transcript_25295/m.59206 type:complete len:253 (+) Transcript_25295:409-1167(+)